MGVFGHEKANDAVAGPCRGGHDEAGVPQVPLLGNGEDLEAWRCRDRGVGTIGHEKANDRVT